MIRINLLPSPKGKKKKKAIEIQSQLILAAVAFSIMILVLGYVWISLTERVDNLNAQKVKLESELTALKAKVKEVENYEKDKKIVEGKIKIIEQLRKNQSIPVHLLDEISKSLPDRVWLVSLSEQSGLIDLEGKATTNSEIVDFINNLKKSPFFANIQILESRQSLEENIAIYSFKLKWSIVT